MVRVDSWLSPPLNFLFLISFIAIYVFSCKSKSAHPIQFYYWKSANISHAEKGTLHELNTNKLYLRLFDVAVQNGTPTPQGVIGEFDSSGFNGEIIPVVFITNETIKTSSRSDIEKLAQNVASLVESRCQDLKIGIPNELQIDCDWTASTKTRYFQLLTELQNKTGKTVTCTLRLHQVKYKNETGIPPVAKVYLMCYATSSPFDTSDTNSILHLDLLKDYLTSINEYPLKFDVALPLYSWAIVTNHLGKIKLINGISEADLTDPVYQPVGAHVYQLSDDTFLRGVYLNKGFQLKVETITPELLQDTKAYLNNHLKSSYEIIYYHLDSTFVNRYNTVDLL